MEKEKHCPECGELIGEDERFCSNCGTELSQKVVADNPVIGSGARANIMGGINKTVTTHHNVNTSNVDNSSTVNHNTTYVMNEKKTEYCEVCGNSLEEKHARCPKCGKEICLECKVKGKNRCVECEKKAVDDYRVAFQQFLLASNGNIGSAGRQLMSQKARDLDVEDVRNGIEKELLAFYQSVPKAIQPEVIPTTTVAVGETKVGAKGGYTSDGRKAIQSNKSNNTIWMLIVGVLVVIIVAFVLLNGEKKGKDAPAIVSTEQVQEKQEKQSDAVNPIDTKASKSIASKEQQAAVKTQIQQQTVPETDANYDVGMKAYEAGNGLDAVNAFKKSGSAKAYYMLGLIYENGCGNVGKNAMMARKNFKKAAQMGSEEAKAKL